MSKIDKYKTKYNKILKKYWGYDSLKEEQFVIINTIINESKDICAILATGFGKSICYQLPFLITNKCVVVISPLIALMYEQSNEMINKNIPVAVFNSEASSKKKDEEKKEIINGTNKLIFMTPEYFIKSESFLKSIEDSLLMVCIDEAHAVSTWGLDFRPSYTKLGVIRDWLPNIPILTLTATASTKVRQDIKNILNLNNPELIIGNFDRPNLLIRVESRDDDIMERIDFLLNKYLNEYIIIYCKTREETDILAGKINKLKIKCKSYHAGMSDKDRTEVQQQFITGELKCIIATIAFGMGINIPNVRLVIHYNCPKNIESYYQEIGRAGRDGQPSECVLFFSAKDFRVNRYFLQSIENPIYKVYQEDQIRQIEKYTYSNQCRRKIILENFGQKIESCISCDNCLKSNKKIVSENVIDYTPMIYLFLSVLYKLNDKFGSTMIINVLLGKTSKVKNYMCEYYEYGCGISFGNIDWWKQLFINLKNDELVQENQVTRSFFTTTSLTSKGNNYFKKLNKLYPNYKDLLIGQTNDDELYKDIIINYPEIIIEKKIVKVVSSKVNKSKYNKQI